MALSGLAVAYTAVGGILLWSGIKGETFSQAIKDVTSGKALASNTQPIGSPSIGIGSGSSSSSGSFAAPTGSSSVTGVAALKSAAKAYGWDTGSEWSSLNYVEMREAGYNSHAKNPSSGALGLAQALGHGNANTAGSLGNEYGGYGLSDAQAKEANSGNAYWQAVWMVNYIKATYGDPIAAANHEKANNWY